MALEDLTEETVVEGISKVVGICLDKPRVSDGPRILNYLSNYYKTNGQRVKLDDVKDVLELGVISYLAMRDIMQANQELAKNEKRQMLAMLVGNLVLGGGGAYGYAVTSNSGYLLGGVALITLLAAYVVHRTAQTEQRNILTSAAPSLFVPPTSMNEARAFYSSIPNEKFKELLDRGIESHTAELKRQKYL
ncbi:hypothetical protein J4207_01720 [Candidatus Woesearchaeota archaeon]|nr:hypothetical protein [Candidatus Woesearchaeota archaeon]